MAKLIATKADIAIKECLKSSQSFALVAGAGSGKTRSLVTALEVIRAKDGPSLRKNGQRIACITYTNRAVGVIQARLGFDDLYHVSTLHGFLWGEICRFQKDIFESLQCHRIPSLLAKARERDSGRDTQEARKAREQVVRLENDLANIKEVKKFNYDDSQFSNYLDGQLNHDDIIDIAGYLLAERPIFRRILGSRYPYIFVDEAQDTFENIVAGLNLTCSRPGLPLVGYFGDPWQQIYEGRAGNFTPPEGGLTITKVENFRCSPQVIKLLNAFRRDVQQVAAGDNKDLNGSVEILLARSSPPEGERRRYSENQLQNALATMDLAIKRWGWEERADVVRLFLVRQMIARRLGFINLHQLFTGQYASARAQDEYESGEHYLIKPFLKVLCPLMMAYTNKDDQCLIDVLRSNCPAFSPTGFNATTKLKTMIAKSKEHMKEIHRLWQHGRIKEIFKYCRENRLLGFSDRLLDQMLREPRREEFNDEIHREDKGDWLADAFLDMPATELLSYYGFMMENTAYSTQHGVKGEEYDNVMVVYDDVEAYWNQYSFVKLLTPHSAGNPTEGQEARGRKLAYVCFSRARLNLRILLFTPSPDSARHELIDSLHLDDDQITIL